MNQMILEQRQEDMTETTVEHIPVMLREVMTYLNLKEKDVVVDGTVGLGGHAEAILKRIGPQGRLVGIDRDARSLQMARQRLNPYLVQCDLVQEDFRNIHQVVRDLGLRQVDAILLDLGISSYQLNDPQRGFSFQSDGPLDMRMDQSSPVSAFDLVNSLSEKEISAVLRDCGEERWHNRIARFIVIQRSQSPIETTRELREVVLRAQPHSARREKIHPATRTFQAFRIAVNRELESLEIALEKCVDLLNVGGRMAVIAFHSLEDRIVKNTFRALSRSGRITLIVKKPLRPDEEEIVQNPRSRSARLRIIQREAMENPERIGSR
jgi:16S rRNA (cytosine1402-N4)-methyltransferase